MASGWLGMENLIRASSAWVTAAPASASQRPAMTPRYLMQRPGNALRLIRRSRSGALCPRARSAGDSGFDLVVCTVAAGLWRLRSIRGSTATHGRAHIRSWRLPSMALPGWRTLIPRHRLLFIQRRQWISTGARVGAGGRHTQPSLLQRCAQNDCLRRSARRTPHSVQSWVLGATEYVTFRRTA